MTDWSLSRRTVLQTLSGTALVGVAGCSALSNQQTDAIALYVYNETDSELTASVRYLTCNQVGKELQSIGIEADAYSYSAEAVVADSGMCKLRVTVPDGPSDTYEWDVGHQTAVITITSDSIEFVQRSPTFDP